MDFEARVPATVANLGPGFDCLGAAVTEYLDLRFSGSDKAEIVGDVKGLPDNLSYRAFVAAHEEADVPAPSVRIEVLNSYPSSRGMGASAAAIVGGLVGANAFSELKLGDDAMARLAIRLEGHADNVLPALFGGAVLSAPSGWMRFVPVPEVAPVILVAGNKQKTSEARQLLPLEVPRADAVANVAATAALVAVLGGLQPPEALLMATEDRLHEPYRLPHMQQSLDVHAALRQAGVAAALAGAGPSIVCLSGASSRGDVVALATKVIPKGWRILTPDWDLEGARVR